MTMPLTIARPTRPSRIARPAVRLLSRLRDHGRPATSFQPATGGIYRLEFEGVQDEPIATFMVAYVDSEGYAFMHRAYFGRGLASSDLVTHVEHTLPTPDEGYVHAEVYENGRLVATVFQFLDCPVEVWE
ncbi:hypothetical protein EP7_005565 (plasmid) [Isosphaeraceae bacterium EP7]